MNLQTAVARGRDAVGQAARFAPTQAARSSLRQAARSGPRGLGWGVLVATLLAWWLGNRFGWAELTALAVLGVCVLVAAVAFTVGRSAYAVDVDLARRRVVVGERAAGRVVVRNTSTRTLLPAVIELPVGANVAAFPLPRLAGGAEHEDLFTIPTERRTVIVVGPVRSVRGDPLGLLRREVIWTEPEELFVHPRTVPLGGSSSGFLKDLEGRPTRELSPSDVAFHALREYVPGDDRRHIHWRTTARTGTLMVRQFEETRRSHVAIALSTNPADYGDPEEFELAVSAAGSIGLHAMREERDLTVQVQGGALRADGATRLLDDLTRLDLAPRRDDVVALAQALAADVPNVSLAVLVFGATVSPAQMRSAAVRLPVEVRVLAVQCVPGASLSRRTIADLTVLTVGALADLPAAFRRAER